MKIATIATMLLAVDISTAAAAAQSGVKDDSFRDAEGHRVLKETIVVRATPADVWKAFTNDADFTAWAETPLTHITPGNGGMMESTISPDGKIGDPSNVRNRIDVYLPSSLMIFHNEHVPAGGPIDAELYPKVRTLLSFEPSGASTMVTETVVGFGEGRGFDTLYAHLRDGNAEYLNMLSAYFAKKHAAAQ